ncbi:MAG: phosphoribosylglycinamide formyltransferase [Chlorobiota bacterium]|nr:phosphoribosylglycinamide formyltransferase [Chlorobiota bacterium]QQS66106.1 MAG: phosphoribosylglycinamide formyltransferase [Chlorobiota bacterium]
MNLYINEQYRYLNIAVFASGRGSNLIAIDNYIQSKEKPFGKISLLVTNKTKCDALNYASENNIPSLCISQTQFTDLNGYSEKMMFELLSYKIDFIVLAGYLKKIPIEVIKKFKNRIINIHPALLPKFGGEGMYGINIHIAVINAKEKISGVTIHYVSENYDEGEIISQSNINIEENETPESLNQKILILEHQIYPKVIEKLCEEILNFPTK